MAGEQYQGVKFRFEKQSEQFEFDHRLFRLNYWADLLCQLGMTPLHTTGAYGNQSLRLQGNRFIISRSGMTPCPTLAADNYCMVDEYREDTELFITCGEAAPSSESLLHHVIYSKLPGVNAIMHGHCELFSRYASVLSIPTTPKFEDYGTKELAFSALELAQNSSFFILKDHGFVATGPDVDSTGRTVLEYFSKLVTLLKTV